MNIYETNQPQSKAVYDPTGPWGWPDTFRRIPKPTGQKLVPSSEIVNTCHVGVVYTFKLDGKKFLAKLNSNLELVLLN